MKKRLVIPLLFLSGVAFYVITTLNDLNRYKPPVKAIHYKGGEYVGAENCASCHAAIYAEHMQSAHFHTSALAHEASLKGDFTKDGNAINLDDVILKMKQDSTGFFQMTHFKNSNRKPGAEKFDIVIGSGVRGQSYLSWEFDHLFQLQASYYTPTDSWINSPGYPNKRFVRTISDGCLKCHMTFAKNAVSDGQSNRYDKGQFLLGIDCERCHGPAANHVAYHRKHPGNKPAKHILKFSELSRQQRLDVCAQCHSGLRENILTDNPFSFLPGDDLNTHSQNRQSGPSPQVLDVHGNQYGLLTESKCFKATKMDCSTCHNPHQKQRGQTAYFNQKCMTCHGSNEVFCSADLTTMGDDCISCHMPVSPSKMMSFQVSELEDEVPAYVRTHLIGIYEQEKQ